MNKGFLILGLVGTCFYLSTLIDQEDLDFQNDDVLEEIVQLNNEQNGNNEYNKENVELFGKDKIWGDEISGQEISYEELQSYEAEKKVTILAVGDMMLGRYVRVLMDSYGKNYVFEKLKEPELNKAELEFADVNYDSGIAFFNQADLTFGNLEGPIQGVGKKGGTSTNFAFHEDIAPWLKESGFDLVSIANNHALDQGWDGRETTIQALDQANLDWCGHPTEADPESVFYKEINEIKLGFVCFEDAIHRLDYAAAEGLISQTKSNVDYLIVSIHWGYEYQHTANFERQVEPAHRLIDAGADLIIGHHPHVIQNFEIYQGKFIFYSLGNFVFDQYFSQDVQEELAILIEISEKKDNLNPINNSEKPKDSNKFKTVVDFQTTVFLQPLKSENSQSRPMNEEEKSDWRERFINYGDYDEDTKKMIREGILKN